MNVMQMQPAFAAGVLGWIVVAAGALATAYTIVAAAYWIVHPGERDPRHPKYVILRRDR